MKQKNKIIFIFLLIINILLISSCNSEQKLSETAENINSNISTLGIELGMKEKDVFDLIGTDFEKSPCIIGYEYDYYDLNLNLGIDIDKMNVTRITFRSPEYSVYSMPIGTSVTNGSEILSKNGFKNEGESKFKFVKQDTRITMISMDGKTINGFTVEFI